MASGAVSLSSLPSLNLLSFPAQEHDCLGVAFENLGGVLGSVGNPGRAAPSTSSSTHKDFFGMIGEGDDECVGKDTATVDVPPATQYARMPSGRERRNEEGECSVARCPALRVSATHSVTPHFWHDLLLLLLQCPEYTLQTGCLRSRRRSREVLKRSH